MSNGFCSFAYNNNNNNNNNNDLLSTVSHHKKFTKQNKYNICDKRNRTKPKLIFKP